MNLSLLHEMKPLSPIAEETFKKGEVQVSLIIPIRNGTESFETTLSEAHLFLSRRYPGSFEIILVPNPAARQTQARTQDRSIEIAENLATRFDSVQVCPHFSPAGKGAAIRTGILASKGKWIFFTDADLPYDLEFFDRAASKLKSGYDLVTGNRRLPESHFNIPVQLLRLAYGRHRLGLAFNRLVRWLLPISTTDTQAGIKAFSRRLAVQTFSRQICPGFLFDLEIFLTAIGHGYWQAELPVTLYLNSEKSTVRILRECVLVANWLTRIKWKTLRRGYGFHSQKKIISRYREASLSTRLFLTARWKLTPYDQMASRLPPQGKILDLGCGHGLFTLAAALNSPSREIFGIDHDIQRINLGVTAVRDLPNVRLETGSMVQPSLKSKPYSAIAMIDVMHYFDPQTQEVLVKQAFDLLEDGGKLLIREVDPQAGVASAWNRFYEKMATGIGFTQTDKKAALHFRSRQAWENLMKRHGFRVNSERCSSFLFADILYVCERPNT